MRFTTKLLITTTLSLTLAVPAQSQEFRTVQVGAEAQSPVLGGVLLALLMLGIASVGSDGRGAEVTPPPDPDTPPPPPEVIDPEYAPPGGYAGVLRPRYVIGVTPLEEDPRLSGEETGSETFETPEYANSWGLGQIGASSRYAQGAFGAGSLVSVFDTGVRLDHPELSGALAPGLSYSYFADGISDVSGHGSHVIGIIAGTRDGVGVHGVAPEARIMALRAIDGPESEREGLFYLNWENAILRSVEAGADVMNNSWTFVNQDGDPVRVGSLLDRDAAIAYFGSDLIGTFAYSAQQDLVSVYAAGNGSGGDASITAGLPLLIEELRDHWVAVVALDQNDVIADYSSQCGIAMQWCLAAPGSDIISAGVDNLYESRSGTSMAAGFVSGSVALLKSNFPEITGATALSILKDTARDLGEMGVDPVYGHGAIDLTAAMRPVGAVSVQLSGLLNERTSPLTGSGIIAPAGVAGAFQGALSAGVMSVTDGYDRSFLVPMGGMVGERTRGGAGPDVARFAARGSSLGVPDRAGTFLSVGAPISDRVSGMPDPARFSAGHAGLIGGDAIAFTHMGEIGSGLRFGVTGAGSTGRHTAGTGLAALSVEADIGSALFTVEAGRVSERSGLLGASFHGAFDGVSSETSYMRLNADLPMGRSGTVHLSASGGDTSATGNGLLRSAQIRSESFGVGFSRRDEATGSVFSLGVSSPVSVSGGRIGMAVPVGVGAASNGVASEQVRVESVSMGLEGVSAPIDLQIGYQVPIGSARLGLGISHRSGSEGGGTTAAIGLSLKF